MYGSAAFAFLPARITADFEMNFTVQSAVDYYNELWLLRDQRVDEWPFMQSIWPTISLCAAYIYISLGLGPFLMKDREAFQLKGYIRTYNVFQVVFSAYNFYEGCAAGWLTGYNWLCQDVDRDPDPDSPGMRMVRVCWLYYMSKFIEFSDTFFFVAKKKFDHVSALQIIHHSIMPLYGFIMVRWLPGGHETFGGTLNCLVHVVMYSYYFLSSFGPHMQKYLWWKKYLTTLQMIQFVVVFSRSMIVIFGVVECGYPRYFSLISASITALFFVLFMHFFKRTYSRTHVRKQK